MSLSYETATVASFNALYDALVAFAVGAGWTVHDTITTRDKVIKSSGTDTKRDMVYRLTASGEAGNPFASNPYDPHKKFSYILARGYHAWNAIAHTGTNEYGVFGTNILAGEEYNTTGQLHVYRPEASSYPISGGDRRHTWKTVTPGTMAFNAHDGRRKVHSMSSPGVGNKMTTLDLMAGQLRLGTANGSLAPHRNKPALVHDPVTDRDYLYVLMQTATLLDQWWRYDIEADTWTRLAAPIWAATAPDGGWAIWDGADTIYCLKANATNSFYKYSIAGDSWTVRANATLSKASGGLWAATVWNLNTAVYVPNSISGIGQDVIYAMLNSNGALFYRYDVTDNAWRAGGAGALTIPGVTNHGFYASLLFDGKKYLYYFNPANISGYTLGCFMRSDVTTAPDSWTALGTLQSTAMNQHGAMLSEMVVAKLRGHSTNNITYWFLGDADHLVAVTKFTAGGSDRYYWIYLGKYDAYYRQTVMTLTGSATAGVRATIPVDDSSAYRAGEQIVLFDPTTGNAESTVIYDIPGATSLRANLSYSYTTGSRCGVDPIQAILTGDAGLGGTALDAAGYKSKNLRATYSVEAMLSATLGALGAPSDRNYYMPQPFKVYGDLTGINQYEVLGALQNVYALPGGTFPKPQSGDTLKINGDSYLYFASTESALFSSGDNRGIVIGPIN